MRNKLLGLISVAALAILATFFVACGGDDEADEIADLGPDPATMVPADAPFYIEAVVRPEGDQATNLESALSKLLVTDDIGGKLRAEIDDALSSEGEDITYSADIEPWLGARGGFFVDSLDKRSGDPAGAAVVAVTDTAAAEAFVTKVSESERGSKTRDYNGIQLTEMDDGAVGIDGDFLVAGVTGSVERAIDAKAGENFAGLSDDQTGLDEVPDDAVFALSANPTGLVDLAEQSKEVEAADVAQLRKQLEMYGDGPVAAWGTATADSLGLGASSAATDETPVPTDVLSSLPADAWLAFGAGGVGEQIQLGIEQAQKAFEANLPGSAGQFAPDVDPFAEIESATGLDLTKDLDWIGDVSGFMQGTSILGGLGGGMIITTDDEGAAKDAVSSLQSSIAKSRDVKVAPTDVGFDIQGVGVPFGAQFAVQDGKFVVAGGAVTVNDVLNPSSTLADSDAFDAAKGAIDDEMIPSLFIDFPPIFELVDSTGQISPDLEAARPYLNALDYLIGGGEVSDGRTNAEVVLGLQDQPESSSDSEAAAVTLP